MMRSHNRHRFLAFDAASHEHARKARYDGTYDRVHSMSAVNLVRGEQESTYSSRLSQRRR